MNSTMKGSNKRFGMLDVLSFRERLSLFETSTEADRAKMKEDCRLDIEENQAICQGIIAAYKNMLETLGEDWRDTFTDAEGDFSRGCVLELAEQAVRRYTDPITAYAEFKVSGDQDKFFDTPAGFLYYYEALLEHMDHIDGTIDWSLS